MLLLFVDVIVVVVACWFVALVFCFVLDLCLEWLLICIGLDAVLVFWYGLYC